MATIDLEGTLWWVRKDEPDYKFSDEGKWSCQLRPTREALDIVRDLQAEGLKNVVKKTEDNEYYVNFSRTYQKKNREGKITKTLTPPFAKMSDGSMVSGRVPNGSKGFCVIDVYTHPTPTGGTAKAARFEGVKITELAQEERASF